MIHHNIRRLLLAGAFMAAPLSLGIAHPADAPTAPGTGVITVQGWPGRPGWIPEPERHQHCAELRHQAHEIRRHIHHAPPWEQEGMQRQLWQIRQQAQAVCSGGGPWD